MTKKLPMWIWVVGFILIVLFIKQTGLLLSTEEICPAVCVPMWKIESLDCDVMDCGEGSAKCIFIECGSGCGPDFITTFSTEEDCNNAIGSCPDFVRNLPTYINMEADCNAGILMIIMVLLIIFGIWIILKIKGD